MKRYLDFSLKGKKLFPYYLIIYITIALVLIAFKLTTNLAHTNKLLIAVFVFLILFAVIILYYYQTKLTIENVSYKQKQIQFGGKFSTFLGKIILGMLLTIVTLGIYAPWFLGDIYDFFIGNSSYDSKEPEFKGKGHNLFAIMILTVFIPFVIWSVSNIFLKYDTHSLISNIIRRFILIPYYYFLYKWMIDIDYKQYHISWKTNTLKSIGKITIECLITLVTLGIYWPLALVKLYKYFSEKTIAESSEKKLYFGFDIDPSKDFLYIWGQILLIIVTLGIYYPWAYCNIRKRIISKTYTTEKEINN